MKERLKSPIVWMGILAQVILLVTLINPEIADFIKVIGTSIVEILTIVGFLNNPADREKF